MSNYLIEDLTPDVIKKIEDSVEIHKKMPYAYNYDFTKEQLKIHYNNLQNFKNKGYLNDFPEGFRESFNDLEKKIKYTLSSNSNLKIVCPDTEQIVNYKKKMNTGCSIM